MPPLLSICVPTYNRAERLRLTLLNLSEQIRGLEGDVEVVVSDNCSTDNTPDVIQAAREETPLVASRNGENIGPARNFVKATCELARGEYCWIIGDDDMIVKGKVAKVLNAIKAHPDLDFFFVNCFFRPVEERDEAISKHGSAFSPAPEDCWCKDLSDHFVERWESLLEIENQAPIQQFTAVVCHVLRRSLWQKGARNLRLSGDIDSTSLDFVFPQIKISAGVMVGRPAFYVGDPCVLLGQGGQEWIGAWAALSFVGIDQAIDYYAKAGVSRRIVRNLRRIFYQQYASMFVAPGRVLSAEKNRYIRAFVRKNLLRPWKLGRMAFDVGKTYALVRLAPSIPRPIFNALRSAKKALSGSDSGSARPA